MAAVILLCGSAGHRSAMTNAVISFSNVRAGGDVDATKQKQIERLQAVLLEKTVKATGLTRAKAEELFTSEVPLTAAEARKLNIIDYETSREGSLTGF
jgi:ATP-dependent protease ClpP protease subunit